MIIFYTHPDGSKHESKWRWQPDESSPFPGIFSFPGLFHAWACGWPWKKAIKKNFRAAVSWKGEGEGYLSCTISLGEAKQEKKFQGLSSLYLLLISFLLTNLFYLSLYFYLSNLDLDLLL